MLRITLSLVIGLIIGFQIGKFFVLTIFLLVPDEKLYSFITKVLEIRQRNKKKE